MPEFISSPPATRIEPYVALKQFPKADEALKRYVALLPEGTFMRGIEAKVEARNP